MSRYFFDLFMSVKKILYITTKAHGKNRELLCIDIVYLFYAFGLLRSAKYLGKICFMLRAGQMEEADAYVSGISTKNVLSLPRRIQPPVYCGLWRHRPI